MTDHKSERPIDRMIREMEKKYSIEAIQSLNIISNYISDSLRDKTIINNLNKVVISFAEELKQVSEIEKYYLNRIDKIKELGWSLSSLLIEANIIEDDDTMTDESIFWFYKANNYKKLFYELESIKYYCKDEFEDTMDLIIDLLKIDMKYYSLCVGTLFAIIDYSFVYQLEDGNMKNGEYLNKKNKKRYSTKIKTDRKVLNSKRNITSYELIIDNYFKSTNFKNKDLTRHAIAHGRYNLKEISESDFFKIVNVCSTFSEFNNPKASITFIEDEEL